MPRVRRIASRVSAVVVLAGLQACSPSENSLLVPGFGPTAIVAVTVSPISASVEVGLTLQMTAMLIDAIGREVPGEVSWATSNDVVATVDDQGLVTGLSAGAVTITATSGTIFRGASVTVVDPAPPTP